MGSVMRQSNAQLTRVTINKFELRWKDTGSANSTDLGFWHSIGTPNGYFVAALGVGNSNSLNYGGSNQEQLDDGLKLYTYDSNNPNEKW